MIRKRLALMVLASACVLVLGITPAEARHRRGGFRNQDCCSGSNYNHVNYGGWGYQQGNNYGYQQGHSYGYRQTANYGYWQPGSYGYQQPAACCYQQPVNYSSGECCQPQVVVTTNQQLEPVQTIACCTPGPSVLNADPAIPTAVGSRNVPISQQPELQGSTKAPEPGI